MLLRPRSYLSVQGREEQNEADSNIKLDNNAQPKPAPLSSTTSNQNQNNSSDGDLAFPYPGKLSMTSNQALVLLEHGEWTR
jgi:hypothetical protein